VNNIIIVKKGDHVFYTGDTKHAVNKTTERLMRTRLVLNYCYEVLEVGFYGGEFSNSLHYKLVGGCGYVYPSKSFIFNNRKYIEEKYNLK